MPVSYLTCTGTPSRIASSMNSGDQATTSAHARAARSSPEPVSGPKIRIGASSPASRSSSASGAVATPSQVEPASSAARAAGTAPCP